MRELEKLKNEVAIERKTVNQAGEIVKQLDTRREEIAGKLAKIDIDLVIAENEQKTAITQYARNEISENQLDDICNRISSLKGKRESIAGVIEVVIADLASAREKETGIRDLLKRREEVLWAFITNNEIGKAAVILRRAWAAGWKSGDRFRLERTEFLQEHIFIPLFTSISDDACRQDVENMTHEYLK